MQNEILVIPISKDELRDLIQEVVREHFCQRKEKKLLTSKGICEAMDISLSTLNNWKAAGQVPFKRMGKRIYYDYAEVVAAMKDSNYGKLKHLKSSEN